VIVTLPSPTPVAPDVTESHDVLLLAVHGHPFAVVIEIGLAAPPPASTFNEVGLTLYEHDVDACVIVTDCPAIVSVPVRVPPVVFAVAVNVAVPLPAPLEPETIDIQATLLTAVHEQPADAETERAELVTPLEGTATFVGVTV
jgi:hypothetical protein